MAVQSQIVGIDAVETALLARINTPSSFAPIPPGVEAALINSLNAELALYLQLLTQPPTANG